MAPKAEAQLFLDTLATLGLPAFETMDAALQREIFDAENPDAPEPPAVHSSEDRQIPGPGGDIGIRIYRPSADEGKPVVVYMHGGGWVLGTLGSHDGICRAIANAADACVVAIDYRRSPEHPFPACFDDCVAGLAWVAANAAEFGGDSSRLAVAGDSAGGNLAAAAAIWARDTGESSVVAQVLIYPATNLADPVTGSYTENADGYLLTQGWMDWFIDQYVPNTADRSDHRASPALASSHAGLAPAIVFTAEFDPLRDDGKAYAAQLTAAGVPTTYSNYEGQIHGFATQIGAMEDASKAAEEMGAFLKSVW